MFAEINFIEESATETRQPRMGYTKPHKKRKCGKHKLPKSLPKNFSSPADNTPFCVLIPENLCFQRPIQRQDSPAEMLAADRERNRLRTDTGIAIIQHNAVAAVIAATFPANQGVCPFPLCWCHAVQRAVRLALQRRQLFEIVFHVCPPLCLIAVFPEKASCPISAACVLRWYANAILRREKYSFFGRSFCFQGAAHR